MRRHRYKYEELIAWFKSMHLRTRDEAEMAMRYGNKQQKITKDGSLLKGQIRAMDEYYGEEIKAKKRISEPRPIPSGVKLTRDSSGKRTKGQLHARDSKGHFVKLPAHLRKDAEVSEDY